MNGADFEDAIFLLNVRIKMARDTTRLNPKGDEFLEKCMDDVAFVDQVLAGLARQAVYESNRDDGDAAAAQGALDYAADTEWQFSQLLTEFLLPTNAFSARSPQRALDKIASLRVDSNERRKIFESLATQAQGGAEETVVSSAELSILLGGA